MNKQLERSAVNFSPSAPNYLLLGFAAVVIVCLLAGMTLAFTSRNLLLSAVFLFSALGIAVFSYLHLRESKKFAVGVDNRSLDWSVVSPESQQKKLRNEVGELSRVLDIEPEQMSDLLSAYIVAEDLALRQIQQEAKMPVVRHVSLAGEYFDAILVKKDLITCIELSFLVTPHLNQEKVNLVLHRADALKKTVDKMRPGSKIRLLLVLVTQLEPVAEAELRSSLKDKFASTSVDVDIRLLDFAALQKTYAME